MTQRDVGATSGSGRWTRIALVFSLALNLAVLGLVAGVVLKGGGHRAHPAMVRDLGFGPFTDALTPQDRAALREAYLAQPRAVRPGRAEMRAEMAVLLEVLRAEPFDPAALSVVMAGQDARMRDRLALGQRLLSERLAAMTPAARHGFADRLEASVMRRARQSSDGGAVAD